MIGLAYGSAASRSVAISSGANAMIGRKAVAKTGIASVAHQIAIQMPIAATRQALGGITSCQFSAANISANRAGPRMRPMR